MADLNMKQLNTRIALRTDVTENWSTNKSLKLLKGEIGIEIFDNGNKKIKIGDGIHTWEQLDYFGSSAAMTGASAPTPQTIADVGTVYVTEGGLIYVCTANHGTTCEWVQLGTSEDANTTYDLTTTKSETEGTVNLVASNPSSTKTVHLKGGKDIAVTSDINGNVTIKSTYTAPTVVDTGATDIKVTGNGVAVNNASYDADSRTITLNKDFTETAITVTDAAVNNGLVTKIKKGTGSHTVESEKGVSFTTTISGAGNDTTLPTTKAVNDFVTTRMTAVDAMRYKGTVDNDNALPTSYKKGDTYKVAYEKSYGSQAAKVGDLFIAKEDSDKSGAGWDLIPSGDDGNTFHDPLTGDTVILAKDNQTIKTLANGANGKVLKIVDNKPAWADDDDTKFILEKATDSKLGGFQTGYTGEGKNYAVKMSGDKAYVNVEWENTEYEPAVSGGSNGLMTGADKQKLDGLTNYSLPLANADTRGGIKVEQVAKSGEKVYDVKIDPTSEKPFVQVPWTDNNTKYTAKAENDLKLSGTEFNVTYSKANLTTDLNKDNNILVLNGGNAAGTWDEIVVTE